MYLQYVILIAFTLQQWLNESASTLRYTYSASFVHSKNISFALLYFNSNKIKILWILDVIFHLVLQ